MSDFSETWKAMSVEQRAKHLVRDWQECRESNEPMVLRVAAVVAHSVLSEAIVELSNLRAERDEARRELCAARRELCRNEAIIRLQRNRVHRDSEDVVGLAKEIAVERGWDCFKEKE